MHTNYVIVSKIIIKQVKKQKNGLASLRIFDMIFQFNLKHHDQKIPGKSRHVEKIESLHSKLFVRNIYYL